MTPASGPAGEDSSVASDDLLARLSWVRSLARELVRDAHAADDLAQATAVAALEHGPDEPRALRAWLRAVVRRLAALSHREAARRDRRELRAATPESQPATVDVVARLALHRRVVDAVEALEEPYRAVILLRFYDGLPPREIAARTATPVKTVETRLARAIVRLRARLVGDFGGNDRDERGGLARALAPLLLTGTIVMATKTKLALVAAGVVLAAGLAWWGPRLVTRPPAAAASAGTPLANAADAADRAAPIAPAAAAVEAARAPELAPSDRAATATPISPRDQLRVRVVDATGLAVAGATVELVRREGLELLGLDPEDYAREQIAKSGTTDASGSVAFEVLRGRPYDVRARAAPNFAAGSRQRYGGESVELALAATATIRGRVVTTSGAPVAAAYVYVSSGELFVPPVEFLTDASGEYVAPERAPGRWWLSVQSAQGNLGEAVVLDLAPGEDRRQDLVVGEGALLRGRVTDALTRAPIAGAELFFGLDRRFRLRTDAAGEYRWPGFKLRGMQPLFVRAKGYGRAEAWLRDLSEGETVRDFTLAPGLTARGRVVDAGGAPLADVYVAAIASAQAVGGQKLDHAASRSRPDGSFELADLRGDMQHALLLRREGFGTCGYAFPEDANPPGDPRAAAAATLELGDFTLTPGGSLEGRVVDADGAPLSGARVVLEGLNADWARSLRDPPKKLPITFWLYTARRECTTDSHGAFHFANLPAGRFEASATLSSNPGKASATVELAAATHRDDLELTIARGLAIAGRIVDGDGNLAKEIFLYATREPRLTGAEARGVPCRDGRFRLEGLAPGEYTLDAEPYGLDGAPADAKAWLTTRREHVVAGTQDVVIEMEEGAWLRGRVVDGEGAAVRGASVTVIDPARDASAGERRPVDTTDDRGGFTFVLPPDTTVTLEVRRPRADPNGRDVLPSASDPPALTLTDVVAEDGEVTLTLPAAGGR